MCKPSAHQRDTILCDWVSFSRDWVHFNRRVANAAVTPLRKSRRSVTGSTSPVADPEGRNRRAPPSKIGSTMSFFNHVFLFFRMLKNKAQIAREGIETNLELPGPLNRPSEPCRK